MQPRSDGQLQSAFPKELVNINPATIKSRKVKASKSKKKANSWKSYSDTRQDNSIPQEPTSSRLTPGRPAKGRSSSLIKIHGAGDILNVVFDGQQEPSYQSPIVNDHVDNESIQHVQQSASHAEFLPLDIQGPGSTSELGYSPDVPADSFPYHARQRIASRPPGASMDPNNDSFTSSDKVTNGRVRKVHSKCLTSTTWKKAGQSSPNHGTPSLELTSSEQYSNKRTLNTAPTDQFMPGDTTIPVLMGLFEQLLHRQGVEKAERDQQQRSTFIDEINRLKNVETQLRATLQCTKKAESDYASRYREESAQSQFLNEELAKSKNFSKGLKADFQREKINAESLNKEVMALQEKMKAATEEAASRAKVIQEFTNAKDQAMILRSQNSTLEKDLAEKSQQVEKERTMKTRLEGQLINRNEELPALNERVKDNHQVLLEKLETIQIGLQSIEQTEDKLQIDKLAKNVMELSSRQFVVPEDLKQIKDLFCTLESR
jgi:hypothetical protein